jgi:hypothetical protein
MPNSVKEENKMANSIQPLRSAPTMFDEGVGADGAPFPVGVPSPVSLAPGWKNFVRFTWINATGSHASISLQVQGNGHRIIGIFAQGWSIGENGRIGQIKDLGWMAGADLFARVAKKHGLAVYALVEGIRGAGNVVLAEAQDNNPHGYPVITVQIQAASASPAAALPIPGPSSGTAAPAASTTPTPTPTAPAVPGGLFGTP